MFKRKKKVSPSPSPYNRMHEAVSITWGHKRLLSLFIRLVPAWLLTGVFALAYGVSVAVFLWVILITTGFVIFLFVMFENLRPSDEETTWVRMSLDFLRREQFDDHVLEAIDKRAEIGSAASQTRTLMAILGLSIAIPSLLPVFVQARPLNDIALPLSGVGVLLLGLFRELERANTDTNIRHAIAEYRSEQKQRALMEHNVPTLILPYQRNHRSQHRGASKN